MSESNRAHTVSLPVRTGKFGYVRVARNGDTHDLHVDAEARERGEFQTLLADGDRVMEIALGSTSDPDLDPARGQIWPPDGAEA